MKRIGILGAGTWGTALANLLTSVGHQVMLWSRFPEEVNSIMKTHKHKNLPEVEIDRNILYSCNIEEAVEDKDVIVMAVPPFMCAKRPR